MSKISAGTGLLIVDFDRDNKKISIDFSGNDDRDGYCYRNDASILFFSANSYRSAFFSLGRDLEKRFESYVEKDIEHLILPYLFNFRHFVELELKAIYVTLTDKSPAITHDLTDLIGKIKNEITDLNYSNIDHGEGVFFKSEKFFEDTKNECLKIIEKLKTLIDEYLKDEPAVEYYRYIFENEKVGKNRELTLNNPIISFDFNSTNTLFLNIRDLFDKLHKELNRIVFVQFSF